MNIDEIRNPLFLKDLSDAEIKKLCGQLRDEIIDYCSKNGGYLSGNLSSIELTVMLNKMFTGEDRLIFDGNDLNYANKILNGNKDKLQVNLNGAYSLANAAGVAASRDLEHKDYHVVCVVNSMDLLSGRNIEALNMISEAGNRLIIVYNDDTTIDKGIGLIDRLISSLRNTRSYNTLKDNVKGIIRPAKGGEKLIENIHNFKTGIKKTVIDEGIFSEFNIDYIGPIDGHNLSDLKRAFEIASQKTYPTVVHCLTTKGKGFRYAEASTNDAWNRVGPFDKNTGRFLMEEKDNYHFARNIAGSAILKLMEGNDDIVCITSRNINEYGVAPVFAKYPDHCFNTSSSAENSLSFASGLSLEGKIPFVVLKSFELPNAFKILKNQICKLDSTMVIGLIDDGSINYDLLANLNNIYICEPSDAKLLQNYLYTATRTDKPVIVIYPDKCLDYQENETFEELELGIFRKIVNNDMNDTAIISSGGLCASLSEFIDAKGLKCDLIAADSCCPLDEKCLDELIARNKKIILTDHKIEIRLMRYLYDKNAANRLLIADGNDFEQIAELVRKA